MSGARWVVRSPDGDYAIGTLDRTSRQRFASKVDLNTARGMLDHFAGWRIVRLLSPAESRRKAAAEALRALAVELRERATKASYRAKDWQERGDNGSAQYELGSCVVLLSAAEEAEARANALWPRKGAGR